MYGQRIRDVMAQERLVTAAPDDTAADAARLMASQVVSGVLVVESDRLVGIFTERDAVFRVLAKGRDAAATPLRDVMTPNPFTLPPNKSFGHALALMHERRIRHVPVVEEGGRPVGMVTARDALDPDMEEFVCEANRRVSLL